MEVEADPAVHLSFEGLDAADVAFDRAAAVLKGEAVGDGGLIATGAAGEGVQVGQVVRGDGRDSVGQALSVATGHHLCECRDRRLCSAAC